MKIRFLAALCAASAAVSPALAASPLDLSFESAPAPQLWTPFVEGNGPAYAFVNGRLELSMPASASGSTFATGLRSECQLSGDFDIALEYLLLDWPLSNGVRSGIVVGGSWTSGAVERTSFGSSSDYPGYPREVYLTHMGDGVNGIVETPDFAGTLRLQRSGTTLTGYRSSAEGWVEIHTGGVGTEDVAIALQAWSHDYAFVQQAARLAFTAFEVRSGRVVCGGSLLAGVDLKPGSAANPIRVGSNGVTPVAFLSSATFDATTIDPATVAVAGAPVAVQSGGQLQASIADVNGDGRPDLVVQVPTAAMQLPTGTSRVAARGTTFDGVPVTGYDRVTLVP